MTFQVLAKRFEQELPTALAAAYILRDEHDTGREEEAAVEGGQANARAAATQAGNDCSGPALPRHGAAGGLP